MKFIHSYFEKGCRKKCTRQSRKVLWVVLRSPLITVQKNLKEWHERPRTVCLQVLKKSNKSRFDSYSVRNSVMITSHISMRVVACTFFPKTFFSWNSCIHLSSFLGVLRTNEMTSFQLDCWLNWLERCTRIAKVRDGRNSGKPEVFRAFFSHLHKAAYLMVMIFSVFISLYYYMKNFCNFIGLEQWYFSVIWNTYMWKLQTFCR